MKLTVKPAAQLKARFRCPGSKSYSIRAFIIAACGGVSVVKNPSDCDDALVAMKLAKTLGSRVKPISSQSFEITANLKKFNKSMVDVAESGTALRFILPLLSLEKKDVVVNGTGTLVGRPNVHLTETLRQMGVDVKGRGSKESVPIKIKSSELSGSRQEIDGSLSSQFISALLIACPQISEDTFLFLKGKKLVSSDYILMTRQILQKTGVRITAKGARQYLIKGNQTFKGLKNFDVPTDFGLAAFHLAAGSLIKSDLVLEGNWDKNFVQADGHILRFLRKMGVCFKESKKAIRIKGPFQLKGGTFSLADCPDLVPIMSILALFAKSKTRLTNIAHARAKESDRISDLRDELLKIGADVSEKQNELIINPLQEYKANCLLDPHHDHRLAMAFAVLGLKIGVKIKDVECTSKSYPGFVKDFKSLIAKY
ncbi:3-phosphoshikimate 1-carboxyvinyltransferase [hydrothermal vent metagenome]|uniref:3-phosphoshikimate 1-carboxyvinyltransferase n=1 Tax=hydrothermal vent metagenome TaxID=652676 RepID=A0A3B0UEP6_9ZZZZ